MVDTKDQIIKKLGLEHLPGEGGYFRRTYQNTLSLEAREVGIDGSGPRILGTAIYYLVTPGEFSALHRLKSDEIFHFYGGSPVEMIQINPEGTLKRVILGSDILAGQSVQVVVPGGTWQGTRLVTGGPWALMGTTMTPGFDFIDFELGHRKKLATLFPELVQVITQFTRENE